MEVPHCTLGRPRSFSSARYYTCPVYREYVNETVFFTLGGCFFGVRPARSVHACFLHVTPPQRLPSLRHSLRASAAKYDLAPTPET